MPPSCPHGDQPDVSLRVVCMGEILRADATLLVTLADLLQTSGLLPLAPRTTTAGAEAVPHPARPARASPAREACTHSDKRSWNTWRGHQSGAGHPG